MNKFADYAKKGIKTVPLRPRRKEPAFPGWQKLATDDPKTTQEWDKSTTNYNIGIPTGKLNNLWVLDIDGQEAVKKLTELSGGKPLPDTPIAKSGRKDGGYHIYFKWDQRCEELDLSVQQGVLGSKMDIRATGGYIVAPPSIHPDTGSTYAWEKGKSLQEVPLAAMPDWIYYLIKEHIDVYKKERSAGTHFAAKKIEKGRWDFLRSFIASLWVRYAMDEDELLHNLKITQERRCVFNDKKPYPESELKRLVKDTIEKFTPQDYSKPFLEYDQTDSGYRDQFLKYFGDIVRYDTGHGFYLWNGSYWASGGAEEAKIYKLINVDLREHLNTVMAHCTKQEREWADRLGSDSKVSAVVRVIKNLTSISQPNQYFNRDKIYFNCANGVIDLTTGKLLDITEEERRELYQTEHSPASLKDPEDLPTSDVIFLNRLLLRVFGHGNKDYRTEVKPAIRYFQTAVGYAMTGETGEQVLFQLKGQGGTGKGTVINGIKACMGTYFRTLDSASLMLTSSSSSGHNDTIASQEFARYCDVSEIQSNHTMNDSLVKQLTGQNTLLVSYKYKSSFEYTPQFKLFVQANFNIKAHDGGTGSMKRRLVVIPFNVSQPTNEVDIYKRVSSIRDTMLRWCVEGALMWQERKRQGLTFRDNKPKVIQDACDEVFKDMDKIGSFIREYFVPNPNYVCRSKDLQLLWKDFCLVNGYGVNSAGSLLNNLKDRTDFQFITYGMSNTRKLPRTNYFGGLEPTEQALEVWKRETAKILKTDADSKIITNEMDKAFAEYPEFKGEPLNVSYEYKKK